ncbi:MAG: CPXCG motif-containing cysteine-rich protein [Deltaproteobacteria bacterium]|nr:CPXCG motif-containing cysteine-rich protein [Deltaproteobacteria bacterium]
METPEQEVQCPFCGEPFTIVVDTSVDDQSYVEDCYVCCRPINFHVVCEDGEVVSVNAAR